MKKMKLTVLLLLVTFAVAFCQPDKVFKEQITVEKGIKYGDGTIQLTAGGGGGSMVYPASGIAVSTGTAWGASILIFRIRPTAPSVVVIVIVAVSVLVVGAVRSSHMRTVTDASVINDPVVSANQRWWAGHCLTLNRDLSNKVTCVHMGWTKHML